MLEAFTVFSTVNCIRAGADNRYACSFQCTRQFQRRLPAVLYDNPFRFFDTDDFQYIFQCDRLKIETV